MAVAEEKKQAAREQLNNIIRAEKNELAKEYNISSKDIVAMVAKHDGKKTLDFVYRDRILGGDITLSSGMGHGRKEISPEYAQALKEQVEYKRRLSLDARDAYQKAGFTPEKDPEFGHGAKYNEVMADICKKNDERLRTDIGARIRQNVRTLRKNFKDLPKDKESKERQKALIKDAKSEWYAAADADYRAATVGVNTLSQQLDALYKNAHDEIENARAAGADEKDCKISDKTAQNIRDTSKKLAQMRQEQKAAFDMTEKGMSPIAKAVRSISEMLGEAARQAGETGRKGLARIADGVHDMVQKSKTRGKTAFRGMGEKVSQIGQSFNARCYAMDMAIIKEAEKHRQEIIDHYTSKNAERKAARKNLGRNIKTMFTGKNQGREVTVDDIKKAEMEKHLKAIDETIKYYKEDARECLEAYQKTAEKNVMELSELKGNRENAEMGQPGFLKSALNRARTQAEKANKDRIQMENEKPARTGADTR